MEDDGYETETIPEEEIEKQIECYVESLLVKRKRNVNEKSKNKKRQKVEFHEDLVLKGGGKVPGTLGHALRDYQVEGVNFLYGLFCQKRGGILADDMGLGKTVQSIAFMSAVLGKAPSFNPPKSWKDKHPCILVVTPASVLTQWVNEMEKWGESFGGFEVVVYHGDTYSRKRAKEVLLTSYETYRKDFKDLNAVSWFAALFDEVHRLKSPSTQTSKAAKQLSCKRRYGLTGTVMQNKLEELWNLIDWSSPGLLGNIDNMRNQFINPIQWGQRYDASPVEIAVGRRASLLLSSKVSSVVLRRDKTLIAHLLPEKIDRVVFCPLAPLQQEAYDRILELPEFQLMLRYSDPCKCGSGFKSGQCHGGWTSDGIEVKTMLLGAVSRLQKLANHPFLLLLNPSQVVEKQEKDDVFAKRALSDSYSRIKKQSNEDRQECSGKLQLLRKLLPEWKKNKSKVLIFSKSTRMLDILGSWLDDLDHSHLRYDGSIQVGAKRQKIIDDFSNDPSIFILLLSTGAGALGLNITAANIVVIFDPSWNASIDLQAQDRAFRMGQKKDCRIFRFVSAGTVEEAQYQRQLYKQQMQNISLEGKHEKRLFSGVQGVAGQEGELFGIANLLKQSKSTASIVGRTQSLEDTWKKAKDTIQADASADENSNINGNSNNPNGLIFAQHSAEFIDKELADIEKTIETDEKVLTAAERAIAKKKEDDDKISSIMKESGISYSHTNKDVIGESQFETHISNQSISQIYGGSEVSAVPKRDFVAVSKEDKEKKQQSKKEDAKKKLADRLERMVKQSGLF